MIPSETIDKIRAEAVRAAARWTEVRDACPYPFDMMEGKVFLMAFALERTRIESKALPGKPLF